MHVCHHLDLFEPGVVLRPGPQSRATQHGETPSCERQQLGSEAATGMWVRVRTRVNFAFWVSVLQSTVMQLLSACGVRESKS